MTPELIAKLQKVQALTTSPVEGEAQAAAAMLQRLLAQHNLDIADLEARGAAVAASVTEKPHDLGKAAFKWKLNLAEIIAGHFFCASLVDHRTKTVRFVGRPDNVESLTMLYQWLIDQIRRISATTRKEHEASTGEHVDPLRWQVNFGLGVVSRLGDKLSEIRERMARDEAEKHRYAVVIHHDSEISDYLEKSYGFRRDGRKTEAEKKSEAYWAARSAEREAEEAAWEELLKTDPEAAYTERPWERPLSEAEQRKAERKRQKQNAAYWRAEDAREARARAKEASKTPEQKRAELQAGTAKERGEQATHAINLEPFLTGKVAQPTPDKLR